MRQEERATQLLPYLSWRVAVDGAGNFRCGNRPYCRTCRRTGNSFLTSAATPTVGQLLELIRNHMMEGWAA